jgi:hypothetical protein
MNATVTHGARITRASNPTVRCLPKEGDVVVTRESGCGVKYTVRQVPGVEQFHAPAHEEAIQHARGLAQTAGVDLWCSEDDTCWLLEGFRRYES